MAFLKTSKFRDAKNIRPGSNKRDIFSLRGGVLYKKRMNNRIDRLPLDETEKEYVKQVIAKHDRPGSKGVTREEFLYSLDEMAKNNRDTIQKDQIEKIKKYF